MTATVTRNVATETLPLQDLTAATSPNVKRPLFAGVAEYGIPGPDGRLDVVKPYIEVREGTGEFKGTALVDITPDPSNPARSMMAGVYDVLRGNAAKVILAAGALFGMAESKAEAGFLVSSADMTASRELGASYVGVPDGINPGGLLGLQFSGDSIFRGSATYINPYYAITAGHVTWGHESQLLGVTTTNDVRSASIASGVESITYFPTYAGPTGDFFTPDIAILKLATPLASSYVQQIGAMTDFTSITGVGFGQFGAADLGSTRSPSGIASGWRGIVDTGTVGANVSDYYYNGAFSSPTFGFLSGRADFGDSGGGWYSNNLLVGMTVGGSTSSSLVGRTDILDFSNPEVAQFLAQNTIEPTVGAVPEPSSFVLVVSALGTLALVSAVKRSGSGKSA